MVALPTYYQFGIVNKGPMALWGDLPDLCALLPLFSVPFSLLPPERERLQSEGYGTSQLP
jgi:hypothetical protein